LPPHPEDPAAETPPPDPGAAVPPAPERHGLARFGLYWWVSAAVIIGDQIAKVIVRTTLPLFASVTILPGVMDFVHVRNTGVAFGLLNDSDVPFKAGITTVLAALALAGVGFYARHIREDERLARVGLSLILGGALGNLVDRLRQGYVIDFVDVYWKGVHFWAFNLADASITIGAVLVFIDLLVVTRHAPHPV
jgi:signal peptidase II